MAVLPEKISTLNGLVEGATRIAVVTHTHPDGDAMGSTTALRSYMTAVRGKECRTAIANDYSSTLSFLLDEDDMSTLLNHSTAPVEAERWIEGSDLIFCLDCNGFDRTEGLCGALTGSKAKKVLIDHHLDPQEELFDLCFSETEVSSASELLFQVLMAMPGIDGDATRLPMHALNALMTGMTTDTNNFANSVRPGTLRMASSLLAAGVDRDAILERLYNSYRENRLRLMGYLLGKMKITETGTAYTVLTAGEQQEYGMREGDLEGYVNMPLSIDKVRMSIFLKEDEGCFRVSIRSKRGTSANRCARQYFNGGGHEQASGGRLFIPKDIADSTLAEAYIEKVTAEFFAQI